ncbi:NAD(P)-binding protein [Propioniciclava sp. MC1595]|uniref:NAD(P)-binding protein n=1 Tax=Propioniciclava sp. MC1595 TaxID=2760308 RepID=UPI001CB76F3B|nr:NAD(P)-binding protein [Propioniciclava sp. MC1595]
MRTAVVVGAGIGGAAAAVALQQVGWRVIILERAQTTGEVGAGLSIWPSAVAVLGRLGVVLRRTPRPGPWGCGWRAAAGSSGARTSAPGRLS